MEVTENELQAGGPLPIISEETASQLREELGLDISGSTSI